MSSFTCITCKVMFATADIQRDHYKTDWHRYNLKRKVADLPSVTAEEFKLRVNAQKAKVVEQTEVKSTTRCVLCNKNFSSQNAYTNHIQSKKHLEVSAKQASKSEQTPTSAEDKLIQEKNAKNLANQSAAQKTEEPAGAAGGITPADDNDCEMLSDEEEEEEWEGEALGLEQCLFCPHVAKTFDTKMQHMSRAHGFFIPDLEFVTDLEGLMTYLGEKVGEGNVCLWCNEKGKTFYSTEAVQKHMVTKGHSKMLFEHDVLLEYADFYDYRSSYPDGDQRPGDEDEEVDIVQLESDSYNYQLVLPSGASVGHRTLQRYYRQKLRADRPGSRHGNSASRVLAQYKALGWTGASGADAQKRAKDMQFMHRVQWKKYSQLGVKANKLQKHFREQVLY